MKLTNLLLAGILAVIVMQFMPRFTFGIVIFSAISLLAYIAYWGDLKNWKRWR